MCPDNQDESIYQSSDTYFVFYLVTEVLPDIPGDL
jgi:hypothetical protein